ncbi:MAG: hypothetical protein HY908_35910 [Myxococcales bacterium]|nr:hypothetical protein [Myxococcales bacterium]
MRAQLVARRFAKRRHSSLLVLAASAALVGAAVAAGCTGEEYTTGGGASSQGGSGTGGQASGGGGSAEGGGGGLPAECAQASECDALFGAAPCGAWACTGGQCQASAAGCVDDDFDGYGSGASCACGGLDCDDADDTVGDTAAGSCYSGPPGTDGVGTCVAGTRSCTAGVWTPCSGEVIPSGEGCNGQDDDCNGLDDDGLGNFVCGLGACVNSVPACAGGVAGVCTPLLASAGDACGDGIDNNCSGVADEGCGASCVPVAPTGNDATAGALSTPALGTPFLTIQAAVTWAAAHPQWHTVCVAGGAACGNLATYTGTLTMSDGVSVLGSYETTNWTQCPGITTTFRPQVATGVTFPSSVQSATTALDHFQIDRFAAATTAAITVDGASNVVLSNLNITSNPSSNSVNFTRGIDVVNGGQALVTGSHVEAGLGTNEAIAVRAVGSEVHLLANCGTMNAQGRCNASGGPVQTSPGLRHGFGGAGSSFGVYLEDAPSSTIETTAIQMSNTDQGAGIRITGDGTGILLRGNNVFVFDGAIDSHGVWLDDCDGAAPWIVGNEMISGNGANASSRADGIRSIGDCHPVIDSNVWIRGGGEGNAAYPNGVHCGASAQAVSSRCVVLNNPRIEGSVNGYPPQATGVRCDGGSCLRIAGNTITARGAATGFGVWLESTGVMVDDNVIRGGCSATAFGVYSKDSYARLQNNRIFGFTGTDCPVGGGVLPVQTTGLATEIATGLHELDVHSNDIDGGGSAAACASRGISLLAGVPVPAAGSGVFRNNIVRAGACTTSRVGVEEATASTDPRVFEHNDLDPFGAPTALYWDEGASPLATVAAVDALVDMTVGGDISADPLYLNYPADLHLLLGSPCIGAGTATGAPALDMDGAARDAVAPDIGADEN